MKELRDNIATTTLETQQGDLIDSYLNLTGQKIHNFHHWTWLRRKQTFATVASQEDYNLDEEVDRIALIRQRSSPQVLQYISDPDFYKYLPNPEDQATGSPRFYRRWEETGFSTNLAAADTIYISSSSSSDGSSFTVRVRGRNSSGEEIRETLTLNGTSSVTSTTTFAASGLLQVSKSGRTTGTITVYRTTGATVLAELAPDELTPRYKRVSLYPIPSSALTMYLEYYEVFRPLVHDTDVPQMDAKWSWVLREGALALMWEYKRREELALAHSRVFAEGLLLMQRQDQAAPDLLTTLEPRRSRHLSDLVQLTDAVGSTLPGYALRW